MGRHASIEGPSHVPTELTFETFYIF